MYNLHVINFHIEIFCPPKYVADLGPIGPVPKYASDGHREG